MGRELVGGACSGEGCNFAPSVSTTGRVVRLLDWRARRGRPRNQPRSQPRDHATLRARWIDPAARPREAIYERESGPTVVNFDISGGRCLIPAVRRRWPLVQLSPGRVDGYANLVERCPPRAHLEPGRRLTHAATVEANHRNKTVPDRTPG